MLTRYSVHFHEKAPRVFLRTALIDNWSWLMIVLLREGSLPHLYLPQSRGTLISIYILWSATGEISLTILPNAKSTAAASPPRRCCGSAHRESDGSFSENFILVRLASCMMWAHGTRAECVRREHDLLVLWFPPHPSASFQRNDGRRKIENMMILTWWLLLLPTSRMQMHHL